MPAEPTFNKKLIGSEGRHLESVSSTNDFLKNLISSCELPHGFYVSTDYQTSGRGQVGNKWIADPGQNLLISVLIRPQSLSVEDYFHLNMSVCLAILDTLNYLHQGFLIKWPNDILFDGRKLAGVLIENSIASNRLKRAVVGIGINVNQREFPLHLNLPAISVKDIMGRSIDLGYMREQLFYRLNQRFDQLQVNPRATRDQYHKHLFGYGEKVRAIVDGVEGDIYVTDVAGDGTLNAVWQGRARKFQFKEVGFKP